jgi:hypothetical protein
VIDPASYQDPAAENWTGVPGRAGDPTVSAAVSGIEAVSTAAMSSSETWDGSEASNTCPPLPSASGWKNPTGSVPMGTGKITAGSSASAAASTVERV